MKPSHNRQTNSVKGSIPFTVDVLCVGHAAFDMAMQVDHHPGADEKCSADTRVECGGGPAANAAVAAARLGGRSAFAGYLGKDIYGERHRGEFEREGVNIELLVRGGHPTPVSVILAKPDGNRTVVNYKERTPPLKAHEVDFSRCQPKVILFDGHEADISLALAENARKENITTVLDAGSVHRGTEALAPLVDYLIASRIYALTFTGRKDPEKTILRLSDLSANVIVTLGQDGLIWRRGEKSGSFPAFQVQAVDTTGAGDAFHGAFALGLARRYELMENLRFSSAVAALTCTALGARKSIPRWDDVEKFLSNFRS